MLETADALAVPPMQRAVISALSSLPVADRVETVTRRMLQAGNKDYLYYLVLASTGQPDALATVVKGFRSNTGVKREQPSKPC